MDFLDYALGEFRWYRRWRGGLWQYAACPDGGWFRAKDDRAPARRFNSWPDVEDYRR